MEQLPRPFQLLVLPSSTAQIRRSHRAPSCKAVEALCLQQVRLFTTSQAPVRSHLQVLVMKCKRTLVAHNQSRRTPSCRRVGTPAGPAQATCPQRQCSRIHHHAAVRESCSETCSHLRTGLLGQVGCRERRPAKLHMQDPRHRRPLRQWQAHSPRRSPVAHRSLTGLQCVGMFRTASRKCRASPTQRRATNAQHGQAIGANCSGTCILSASSRMCSTTSAAVPLSGSTMRIGLLGQAGCHERALASHRTRDHQQRKPLREWQAQSPHSRPAAICLRPQHLSPTGLQSPGVLCTASRRKSAKCQASQMEPHASQAQHSQATAACHLEVWPARCNSVMSIGMLAA
mmetsp:Transcript_60166/g.154925  ORF Transcript_60166/g.154925 Transcript_60166/m.154925 type:complete len:343 (-) Transcript_60166:258-1286(-)